MKIQERLAQAESQSMEAFERTLLYMEGVSVSFDGFKALNNLSFAIEPGRQDYDDGRDHRQDQTGRRRHHIQ